MDAKWRNRTIVADSLPIGFRSSNTKYELHSGPIGFARSWMRRHSHVQFCSRDGIGKQPSTITRKKPDFVNNIEEE
jgi:hypothetical protein